MQIVPVCGLFNSYILFYHLDTYVIESFLVFPRSVISPTIKPWYKSESVVKKIQAFYQKYTAVPTDNHAKVCFRKYMENLTKYLKSKDLCDRQECTGSAHFE